eukprot:6997372-Prymnesium_polylepis.1
MKKSSVHAAAPSTVSSDGAAADARSNGDEAHGGGWVGEHASSQSGSEGGSHSHKKASKKMSHLGSISHVCSM